MSRPPPRLLSAHLGYLFTELPLSDRAAAAADAGFNAVEHPQPFAVPSADMAATLTARGLRFTQLAAGVGEASRGEKGLAALPGREADFREGLLRSIDYAAAIGCPFVHPMAGVPAAEELPGRVRDTYLANLATSVEMVEAAGLRVLVEPISDAAVPGYFASRMDVVLGLVDAAAPGRIQVLLDTFHARSTGLDAVGFVREHIDRLGHVHVADHPGRNEPGTGEFDFPALLSGLDEQGYAGAIGFEYVPRAGTLVGLDWLSDATWRGRTPARGLAL